LRTRASANEDVPLHTGRVLVLDRGLDQQSLLDLGHVVSRRPVARRVLFAVVEFAGLERLDHHRGVAVVVVADGLEVVPPKVDRQVVDDETPRLETVDPVRAAAERRLEGGLGEVAFRPVVSWQDRLFADDQRHLAVVRIAEGEANAVAAQLLDLGDALVVEAQLRRALLAHHVEGVDHVVGGVDSASRP
jgi:hypothetical protein